MPSEKTTLLIFASQTDPKADSVLFSFENAFLKEELDIVALPLSDVITLFPSLRSGIELASLSLLFAYPKKSFWVAFYLLRYGMSIIGQPIATRSFCLISVLDVNIVVIMIFSA